MSRITPPMPVPAPPYGSMALGWLCVSTLKHTSQPASKAMMPALSWKTLTHQALSSASVALLMVCFRRLSITSPSKSMTPVNVLCLQCSLQVCASVSSSHTVGSRSRRR